MTRPTNNMNLSEKLLIPVIHLHNKKIYQQNPKIKKIKHLSKKVIYSITK